MIRSDAGVTYFTGPSNPVISAAASPQISEPLRPSWIETTRDADVRDTSRRRVVGWVERKRDPTPAFRPGRWVSQVLDPTYGLEKIDNLIVFAVSDADRGSSNQGRKFLWMRNSTDTMSWSSMLYTPVGRAPLDGTVAWPANAVFSLV